MRIASAFIPSFKPAPTPAILLAPIAGHSSNKPPRMQTHPVKELTIVLTALWAAYFLSMVIIIEMMPKNFSRFSGFLGSKVRPLVSLFPALFLTLCRAGPTSILRSLNAVDPSSALQL